MAESPYMARIWRIIGYAVFILSLTYFLGWARLVLFGDLTSYDYHHRFVSDLTHFKDTAYYRSIIDFLNRLFS